MLTAAAESEQPVAQVNLGLMCLRGLGGEQSDEAAFKWFTRAAEQGESTAQYLLARMYEHGRGVAKSNQHAEVWFARSAALGNHNAIEACRRMAIAVPAGDAVGRTASDALTAADIE